jgi:two-component sensor histidine kinase
MSLTEAAPEIAPIRIERSRAQRQPGRRVAETDHEAELADMRELQAISTRLIQEDAGGLYDAILDAAMRLLRSDMATMQLYDAAGDGLRLLTSRGFDPKVIPAFAWVNRADGTSCGAALRAGTRVIIPDIEESEHVVGTPAHEPLRRCGIRAAQSTPLVSRAGAIIGMITNHWRVPHHPSERSLLLVDVLARQAADLIDRSRKDERITLLAREAEHRSKNMLASVQAVVRLTKADTAEELKEAITGRINALDNVHRLFVQSNWTGADLKTLVAEELAPYSKREDMRAEMDGPAVSLEPTIAQAVSVTLHELATNAAKYGALSVPGGHVRVTWSRGGGKLVLRWEERGGPSVKEPDKRGFGTRVMDSMIRGQLNGAIRFDWAPQGLVCECALPVAADKAG